MILTEEEAKTKWCPFGRCVEKAWDAVVTLNDPRGDPGGDKTMCIASQCMAWRWGTKPSKWKHITGNIYVPVWDEADLQAGFCGLAGKPE